MSAFTAAECRSCGAPIRWVHTTAGKSMPLNAQPDATGNVVMVDGLAVVSPEPTLTEEPGDRFMPHWATCPHAERWKK